MGAGSVLKLANLGVLSASFTQSKADKSMSEDRTKDLEGNQYTVGYSYNRNRFGFSINHNQRDDEYTDLSRLQYSNLISVNSNKSLTTNTYFATKNSGTFGVGYINTKANDFKNRFLNLSWAPVLPTYMNGVTVSLSANRDFIEKNGVLHFSFRYRCFSETRLLTQVMRLISRAILATLTSTALFRLKVVLVSI